MIVDDRLHAERLATSVRFSIPQIVPWAPKCAPGDRHSAMLELKSYTCTADSKPNVLTLPAINRSGVFGASLATG